MDPKHLFYDDRLKGFCVYCGGPEETRDHVPSKVLLDEPYPTPLPVVPACERCNRGFSLDEEYLACFIECTISGTTDPSKVGRPRIQRKLMELPALATLIASSSSRSADGTLLWRPDKARVSTVLGKLARGHIAFEEGNPRLDEPGLIDYVPLPTLNGDEASELLADWPAHDAWPEIGSRGFLRASGRTVLPKAGPDGWVIVQPGRYRYRVGGTIVQMVLSEYLACTVLWE